MFLSRVCCKNNNDDARYFERGKNENPRFWIRIGKKTVFSGKKILDVGCGHGSMCVYLAQKKAAKIIGIDTDYKRIEFARENLQKNYPHLVGKVQFFSHPISKLSEVDFDIIISKDSFEHIINLSSDFCEMKRRLKKGGRMYIGFGPLYNSPFGDHKRFRVFLIPWGHLFLPKKILFNRASQYHKKNVSHPHDLGLNAYSLKNYKELFQKSGLKIKSLRVNASKNPISRLFSLIRKIPFLDEYFSHNLYCVLEK